MKPTNYEFQSEFARRYFSLGKAEGEAKGKAEGEVKGKVEGKAELLIRLATLKFGSVTQPVQARIRAATAVELDEMAERLLAATTLDAVFLRTT
jgi:predicted transposase YdaD